MAEFRGQEYHFFHNSMKIRRARNQIDQIKFDGQEIKGLEELKIETHNHFKELLIANEQQVDNEYFLQNIQKKLVMSKIHK